MTTEQFDQLIVELRALKAAVLTLKGPQTLGKSPAMAPAAAPSAPGKDIPMPDVPVPNAEDVEVHFGKNKGVPLGKLGIRSIEWYAQDQEPKLKNDGTPFPPREADITLKMAARTIVHQRRGTLPPSPAKPLSLESQPETLGEEVPF